MRLPIGSTGVSASGGTVSLIGRRGEGWARIAPDRVPLADAIAVLDDGGHDGAHVEPDFADARTSADADAPRFAPGQPILWHYGRHIETARVVRDDERGLVVWIPSGSERLEPVPTDGRSPREVPLEERFSVPWHIRESIWKGPGIVRVAPTGSPWSIWFFRRDDGAPDGVYVNLELPHRRIGGESAGVFTRDLVLDLWIDAENPGAEDVWLKDADELDAAIAQGRYSPAQAEAIRVLADHAGDAFIVDGSWPLDEGWDRWIPDAAMDERVVLPRTPGVVAARARTGRTAQDG